MPAIVARGAAGSTMDRERGVTVRSSIPFGLLAAALIVAPLAAQEHQHGGAMPGAGKQKPGMSECAMMGSMMSMMEQGGGMEMMTMMRYAPPGVLKNKASLNLTPDQVSRIEAMTGGGMGTHGTAGMGTTDNPMMKAMQARQGELKTAFDRSPVDSAAIASAVMSMAAMHSSMMAQHLVTAARVRDILSSAQRERLATLPSPCMSGEPGMMMKGRKPGHTH
jgi:hypothetical protein